MTFSPFATPSRFTPLPWAAVVWLCAGGVPAVGTAETDVTNLGSMLDPLFRDHCVKCHGGGYAVQGDVDLSAVRTADDLTSRPELIADLLKAVESGHMPPPEEPPLDPALRKGVVTQLESLLMAAAKAAKPVGTPIRRMTRFQYDNAVRDLFQLAFDVHPLPERMMRDLNQYFDPARGVLPEHVVVFSRPLGKDGDGERQLRGTAPFAQDLRAEHGFDTQGDHLSMSPLLMEQFLQLARSVVDSPDFNRDNVGIWNDFFEPPPGPPEATSAAVRDRLQRFLSRAFRRPVEPAVVDRYARHVLASVAEGTPFVDAMKTAAAAALASPQFIYLCDATVPGGSRLDDFALASRLAFFLWGGLPDDELVGLAAAGTLHEPEVLGAQVERLLRDRRLKRFCDAFPIQWLQLERIIASEPDMARHPSFYFAEYRASMHMMFEPLLVFEAVLVENRPITDFIDSDFSYRSSLLDGWYRDGRAGHGEVSDVTMRRVPITDRRQGGLITTAATMTMTSGPRQTKPITRGAWLATVILNDPPPPPPGNVPVLAEEPGEDEEHLTLRERFEAHRTNPSCAGCHRRIDPLGFAFENYDEAGVWRDTYPNGRPVDPAGTIFGDHAFKDIVGFKDALLAEKDRFARGFAAHLLSYACGRPCTAADAPAIDAIVKASAADGHRIQDLIRLVVLSDTFRR